MSDCYALIDELDQALDWLEIAISQVLSTTLFFLSTTSCLRSSTAIPASKH